MSEYYCASSRGAYTGCNDCGGIRKLHRGKAPRKLNPCVCRPRWCLFTKRTNEPKLSAIESMLGKSGIPHRRNGESWHAPILEVPERCLAKANRILAPIYDIPDDDPRWK